MTLAERFAKSADEMDALAQQARDEGREIEAQFMASAAQGIRNGIAEQQQKDAAA